MAHNKLWYFASCIMHKTHVRIFRIQCLKTKELWCYLESLIMLSLFIMQICFLIFNNKKFSKFSWVNFNCRILYYVKHITLSFKNESTLEQINPYELSIFLYRHSCNNFISLIHRWMTVMKVRHLLFKFWQFPMQLFSTLKRDQEKSKFKTLDFHSKKDCSAMKRLRLHWTNLFSVLTFCTSDFIALWLPKVPVVESLFNLK